MGIKINFIETDFKFIFQESDFDVILSVEHDKFKYIS